MTGIRKWRHKIKNDVFMIVTAVSLSTLVGSMALVKPDQADGFNLPKGRILQ